ncbi:MAG: 4-hydroxy-tetrahydrodipicolinate synthase [Verrucomicrobia bacterium]|nr:4-hydroxy-tetrahydrodipicolinate synthase [Verrucomicrobiota bacterium]
MLKGSFVAIVTPFKNGEVDFAKLSELVEWHVESGTHGIVPCGTTGESPTLSHEEHAKVVTHVIKAVNKRIPVIAGAGSNSTREAIWLTKHARECGADAVLSITPYYNKPTQRGLIEHYRAITSEVNIPIVMYNVPGRTGVKMAPETVAELAKIPTIVGIKEACGSIEQVCEILSLCEITVLSGDDSLTYPMMAVGASGVISVAANVIPKGMAALVDAGNKGNYDEARDLHYKYWRLFKDLFIETNPIPVKTAMGMMGLIEPGVRLPLCPMTDKNTATLRTTLEACGVFELIA